MDVVPSSPIPPADGLTLRAAHPKRVYPQRDQKDGTNSTHDGDPVAHVGVRRGNLGEVGEIGVRRVSVRRARWERWSGPIGCWFRNRWNWRRARRVSADIRCCKTLVIPLEHLPEHEDPDVQRMSEMVESLGYSNVLQYGYGMGEALLVAYRHEPQRLRPFVERACEFTLDQLSGVPGVPELEAGVRARNDLLQAVRDIVAAHPKDAGSVGPT